MINQFKSEGCECLTALLNPPDFANFWKQCQQQGFVPKVTAIGRAILTRPDMDAVGDIGNGLCLEVWWETDPSRSSPRSPASPARAGGCLGGRGERSVQPGSGPHRRRRLRRGHRRRQAHGQSRRPGFVRGGHQGHQSPDPRRPGQVRRRPSQLRRHPAGRRPVDRQDGCVGTEDRGQLSLSRASRRPARSST